MVLSAASDDAAVKIAVRRHRAGAGVRAAAGGGRLSRSDQRSWRANAGTALRWNARCSSRCCTGYWPLTRIVFNTLREWRFACPKGTLDLPTGPGKVEYHANTVERGLKRIPIAAGVIVTGLGQDRKPKVQAKHPGLRAFRYFYASWCINRRADGGLELPAKVVQDRLGHPSIMMTMDVYGHLFPPGDELG